MKLGVMIFATDRTLPMHRLAPEVEARGFESLWVTEKTHVPVSRETPWPGGPLPEHYKRTCDPFVALAAAAATTTSLRVGTGAALLALRDPVIAAKEVATLDWQSGGRVELGVGYGWNVEEHLSHGVVLSAVPERLAEHVAAMRTLWGEDEAEFTGSSVRFERSWSWPKPVRSEGPPVHIAARASRRTFADVASWADGWLPIEGYGDIVGQLPRLRAALAAVERDPADVEVSVYSSGGDARTLDRYRNAGVGRTVLSLPSAPADVLLPALDAAAKHLSG